MKLTLAAALVMITSISFADKLRSVEGIRTEVPANFTIVKHHIDNKYKGTLVFDPKACAFKLIRDGLTISLANDNFLVQFPDGRTAVGQVSDADEKKGRPACFHSLSEKPTAKNAPDWIIIGNKTSLGGEGSSKSNGLVNCKERNGSATTDVISYISKADYKATCAKDSSNCRSSEHKVFIKAGNGLWILKGNEQQGSNIKRDDLKFDESYRAKCDAPTKPGQEPVKPATVKGERTT